MSTKTVLFYGGGVISEAIRNVMRNDDIRVEVCDLRPDRATCAHEEALELCAASDLIMVCVPSTAADSVVEAVAEYRSPDTAVVAVTKGIAQEAQILMSELLEKYIGGALSGLLYGPMLANELMRGEPTTAVCGGGASAYHHVHAAIGETSPLSVRRSDDVHGVALCGVLKNVYALGVGAARESGFGYNYCGSLMAQALDEMRIILEENNANPDTVLSPAGVGDLYATGSSVHSSNVTYGRSLVTGDDAPESEGARSIDVLLRRYVSSDRLPFMRAVHALIRDSDSSGLEDVFA